MRWRLTLLGLVTAGLLALVLAPIFTLKVRVDLPPATPGAAPIMPDVTSAIIGLVAGMVGNWVLFSIVAAIPIMAALIGVEIVRRHRR